MPEMGESVTEGTVLEWRVAVGDPIEEGETLVEVSTDKVDAEVPAPVSGRVVEIRAEVDEEISIGGVLAVIEAGAGSDVTPGAPDDGEQATAAEDVTAGTAAPGEPGVAAEPVDVTMPGMG